MKSNRRWLILFALSLLCSSIILFIFDYSVFHDSQHIFIYTLHDIAFLPIEVLLVTVILHQMLERQATKNKLNKLNMVIGTFFSEVGIPLLRFFASHDPGYQDKKQFYSSLDTWDHALFVSKGKEAKKMPYQVHVSCQDLIPLREILIMKEDFLVRILENPVLLEHESFTDVLQAVFHLTEELKHRGDCTTLPGSDISHLSGDIIRSYTHMIPVWISYLDYLKTSYPYLFSLAVRTNPFTENEDATVRE